MDANRFQSKEWMNEEKQYVTKCCPKEGHLVFKDTERLKLRR